MRDSIAYMAINTGNHAKPYTQTHILNQSFDPSSQVLIFQPVAYDGQNVVRLTSKDLASKVTESGEYTYIAKAAAGTLESASTWQAKRIDSTGTTTWADGDTEFDNVASDLTLLTYS